MKRLIGTWYCCECETEHPIRVCSDGRGEDQLRFEGFHAHHPGENISDPDPLTGMTILVDSFHGLRQVMKHAAKGGDA